MQFIVRVSRTLILSATFTVTAEEEDDAGSQAYELATASKLTWKTDDNSWEKDADVVDVDSVEENEGADAQHAHPSATLPLTICAQCAHFRSFGKIWYDQFCGAEAARFPLRVDPVTGAQKYHTRNNLALPYARDINTDGHCPWYHGTTTKGTPHAPSVRVDP